MGLTEQWATWLLEEETVKRTSIGYIESLKMLCFFNTRKYREELEKIIELRPRRVERQ